MIYLRITDNLQHMNQPFEHPTFRKLWKMWWRPTLLPILMDSISTLCCHSTCSFTMQGAEELILNFYNFSKWQRRICIQNCYHIPLIYQRACMRETNKLLLTWRKQGIKKWEVVSFIALAKGVIILQTAISGWLVKHNWSNCVVWRKFNNIKHIKY